MTRIAIAVLAVLLASQATAKPMSGMWTASERAAMKSALSAAPAAIGAKATIATMETGLHMRVLRAGTNGFTCMPDNPASPGADPMCADKAAMDWLNAWLTHQPPAANKVGFIYMLAGGSDASNTDPYARKPAAGARWVTTGPHVMVVGADAAFYAAYPKGPAPDTRAPFVMWADTPYQHLMAPVKR